MTNSFCLLYWMVLMFYCQLGRADNTCQGGQIKCRSGSQCIDLSYVCNGGNNCNDGSDEDPTICSFWRYDSNCGGTSFDCSVNYYSSHCVSAYGVCQDPQCSSRKDPRICELVNKGKLCLKDEVEGMALNDELVSLLQKAVNMTSLKYASSPCPMFYSKVGDMCLSFFSPAKIPWAEARQFCLSLMGDLLDITDMDNYVALLQYMRMSELTTDYWIGGRFDLDTNSWSWVTDDTPMPLGSPYWTSRYSSTCVPRSPPHTDPFSGPGEALPGAPCLNYVQAPTERKEGWCVALTYEHYYYFSDEECQDNRSPLCIYIDNSSERTHETSENKTL